MSYRKHTHTKRKSITAVYHRIKSPSNPKIQVTIYLICSNLQRGKKKLVKIMPFFAPLSTFCQQLASKKNHQPCNCGSTKNNYLENTLNDFVILKMLFFSRQAIFFSSLIENFSDCLWKRCNPNSAIEINHCTSGYDLLIPL